MEIATCFWSLANGKLINEPLQSAASHMVVQKVGVSEYGNLPKTTLFDMCHLIGTLNWLASE